MLPSGEDVTRLAASLDAAGIAAEARDGGLEVVDPSGNRALVEAAPD